MIVAGVLHSGINPGIWSKNQYLGCFGHCKRQIAWSHQQLHVYHINGLVCASSKYEAFMCASLSMSGSTTGANLTAALMSFARPYIMLYQESVSLQLLSAVGITAFAIWGIVPLARHIRKIFCMKSENWRKSKTYHMTTSYIQPLLLWMGSICFCRILDPIVLESEASKVVKQRLLFFVRSLSTILALTYCLSSMIQEAQKFFSDGHDTNDIRNMGFQFAGKAVQTAVWVAAVSLFMELLGFSTQKWLTAGGLGTVLLTLAGREIFTNFLSSVMLHATRPFLVNEWIQTRIEGYEVSGTVERVGWWSPTVIRGENREAVHIPNHKFTVNIVRNLSQKTHWRIKTHLAISHLDASKINNIVADMRKVLAKNPQVEQQRLHRRVFLDKINPENQALLIMISCFVKTSHFEEYLSVKEGILLALLRVISHHRARLATPIRTVQKMYDDVDVENIPLETVVTHSGATAGRPLLLIDPSSKSRSGSKIKVRDSRVSDESEIKTVSSDLKDISPHHHMTSSCSDSSRKGSTENGTPEAYACSSNNDFTKLASLDGKNMESACSKGIPIRDSFQKTAPVSTSDFTAENLGSPLQENDMLLGRLDLHKKI